VFLPGDNDIGGENEPMNVRKLEKFQETFKQPDVLHIGLIDMFKVRHYILCVKDFIILFSESYSVSSVKL